MKVPEEWRAVQIPSPLIGRGSLAKQDAAVSAPRASPPLTLETDYAASATFVS